MNFNWELLSCGTLNASIVLQNTECLDCTSEHCISLDWAPVASHRHLKPDRMTLVSVELLVDGADSGPALDAVALCYDIFSSIVSSVGPPPRSGGGMWRRPPTVPIGISPRSDITIIGRLQCLFSDFVGDPSNMLVVPEP